MVSLEKEIKMAIDVFSKADIEAIDPFTKFVVFDLIKPGMDDAVLSNLATKRSGDGASVAIPSYEYPENPTDMAPGEDQPYPVIRMVQTGKEIAAVDYGLTLALGRQARQDANAKLALAEIHQDGLRQSLTRFLEVQNATTLRASLVKASFTGASTIALNNAGSAPGAATVNANIYLLQRLAVIAKQTYNMPVRGRYKYVSNYFSSLDLVNDSTYRNQIQSQGMSALASHYVGSIGLVDVISSNDERIIDSTVGSSSVAEGYFLGDQSHLEIAHRLPELCYFSDRQSPVGNWGKESYFHWDCYMGFGQVTDSVNKGHVRAIHITST